MYKDFWIRATIAHNSYVNNDNDVAVSPPPSTNEQHHEKGILTDAADLHIINQTHCRQFIRSGQGQRMQRNK
jgi:hypothetical protein